MKIDISTPVFHSLLSEYLEEIADVEDMRKLIYAAMDALRDWDGDEVIRIYEGIAKVASKEAKYLREREL